MSSGYDNRADTLGTIYEIAYDSTRARPVRIVMRRSVWAQIFNESNHKIKIEDIQREDGIQIIIDDTIPMLPGYQIHREM